jgi:predicted HTH transcriptional regulator
MMSHITEYWKFYLTVSLGLNIIWLFNYLFSEAVYEKAMERQKFIPAAVHVKDLPQMWNDAKKAGFTKKPKASAYFAAKWKVSYSTARKRINAMINEGYIERVGSGKNTAYRLVA